MKSHSSNPCAGAFADWLDVMLLKECNGHCSWCIERNGYHPDTQAPVDELVKAIVKTSKKNIVLLGGEPTLYKDLCELINGLYGANLNVYLTTNGSLLSKKFVLDNHFHFLKGVNISVHHFDLIKNHNITGVFLNFPSLLEAIRALVRSKVGVRLNCNCFKGGIDSYEKARAYIAFAKLLKVKTVRFSEITGEDKSFVKLEEIFEGQGLPDCPFEYGCNHGGKIDGIYVVFRQMCGLRTSCRKRPRNPEQAFTKNNVMYYDGKCYDGWMTNTKQEGESKMPNQIIKSIVDSLLSGEISKDTAVKMLGDLKLTSKSRKSEPSCHTNPTSTVDDGSCHGKGQNRCH